MRIIKIFVLVILLFTVSLSQMKEYRAVISCSVVNNCMTITKVVVLKNEVAPNVTIEASDSRTGIIATIPGGFPEGTMPRAYSFIDKSDDDSPGDYRKCEPFIQGAIGGIYGIFCVWEIRRLDTSEGVRTFDGLEIAIYVPG